MISSLQAPAVPIGSSPRYTIEYRKDTDRWSNTQTCYTSSMEGEEVTCSLNHLERATNYSVKIRMEYRYFECGYLYANGNYSETLYFQTNATSKLPQSM